MDQRTKLKNTTAQIKKNKNMKYRENGVVRIMKETIYDEKERTRAYSLPGDYYLPDLGIIEEESTYGNME